MWRVSKHGGVVALLAAAALGAACGEDLSSRLTPALPTSTGGTGIGIGGTLTLGGGPIDPPSGPCGNVTTVTPLSRLSLAVIDSTLDALFGPGTTLASQATRELGYQRALSSGFISALRTVAIERVQVVDSASFKICDGADEPTCIEPWLADWGKRLYRRPLTTEQVTAYTAQFRSALKQHTPAEAAQNVLVSMLLSPYFVFRVELGESRDGQQLSAYEVATRLSHFAARQAPDLELLARADAGALQQPTELVAQLHRLWETPQGRRTRTLQVLELLGASENTLPTTLDADLRADMVTQAAVFVDDIFASRSGSFLSLLTSPHQPLTQRLALHYGVPVAAGDGVQFVDLDPNTSAGVLSQGLFLSSYPRPTLRGRAIIEGLLCRHIPEHPPLIDQTLGTEGSPRERIQQVTSGNPVCLSCHQQIDPVGFALDAYDEQGRATGFDTTTTLPAEVQSMLAMIASPRELGRQLAGSLPARACVAQRYLEAAIDRPISDAPFTTKVVLPPGGNGAPVPIRNTDPDHEWIDCVVQTAGGADFNLMTAAEVIVASNWLQKRASVPKHFAAFDTSLDPVEHAYQETAQFRGAFPDASDDQTIQLYMDGLRDLQRRDALPQDQPGNGGAGGDAAAGAPGFGGAP
jgi:Protein of unknown function (DUF1592)/Protein of unknown function (DUF1588)/Protein of unknown function (DUF1595)